MFMENFSEAIRTWFASRAGLFSCVHLNATYRKKKKKEKKNPGNNIACACVAITNSFQDLN